MKLSDFPVLSFDCYGTLIDWETGILRALEPLAARRRAPIAPDFVLETYARLESAQEAATPGMIYADVLAAVHRQIAAEWGIETSGEDSAAFAASIVDWPAFADSPAALEYLKRHYKLVILSNVDRKSFRSSNARLMVEFDHIYTAEDIGSYKPSLANFEYMLGALGTCGFTKKDILHTAESLFHDHAPANRLGLASAWIHRRHAREGFVATARPKQMPHVDFRFTSLAEMVDAHRREMAPELA
jgi:2-haloacid dehalogenase